MKQEQSRPLERYLSLLEVVAAAHRGLALSEIRATLNLPKPTVYRLVRALLEAGALETKGGHGRTFMIGSRIRRILMLGHEASVARNYAQMICDELAERAKQTAFIVRLEYDSARTLAVSYPEGGLRIHVSPGADLPAHAAASTKAILAFQPPEVQRRLLREPLQKFTNRTLLDVDEVRRVFNQIRRNGYAVCDREIEPDVTAYASPVHVPEVGVFYSVAITGHSRRLDAHPVSYWTQAVKDAAQRFASMLATVESAEASGPSESSGHAPAIRKGTFVRKVRP